MKPFVVLSASTLFLAACLTPDARPSPERDAGAGGMGGQGGTSSAGGGGAGGAGGTGGAAKGDYLWGQAFGALFLQRAVAMALDPMDDSIFVTGNYEYGFSFTGMTDIPHGGATDIFLAKFKPEDGTYVSRVDFQGDYAHQYVTGIAVGADRHVHLTGYFDGDLFPGAYKLQNGGQSDVFVAKLDPDGMFAWTRKYGDGTTQPKLGTTIAVNSKGETIIAGYFEGSLEFVPNQPVIATNRDIFLAKLDKDGTPVWSKRLGNGNPGGVPNHLLCRIVVDHLDNIVLATAFSGSMSLGMPLTDVGSVGNRAILLAKLDPEGTPIWQHVFGAANAEQRSRALAIDAQNNILLTGDMTGTVNFGGEPLSTLANDDADLFVAKFDPEGKHLWSLRAGSTHTQEGRAIAVDEHDNVIVTGSYQGFLQFTGDDALGNSELGAGNYDLFALKLDPNGKYLWAKRFGNTSHQIAESMAIDREGNTIFAGFFDGSMNLPDKVITSKGSDDIFVLKLSP
ncbi:hypothetical protein [Polyangium sorediatum]|uniref:Lipoprotein n=1 Tax=Polyangium sorediatum TaxID=889274 RepID=A0ABT6NXI3_9BACT|nr:hypothetical protein [Polyangium sorediatum]MDI1433062.1 hypothetical protein [Polyangium sorediatum]